MRRFIVHDELYARYSRLPHVIDFGDDLAYAIGLGISTGSVGRRDDKTTFYKYE